MRALFAPALVMVLCGATCQHREQAPVADADPQCYRSYVASLEDTGVRWECADPNDVVCWDDLGKRAAPDLAARALGGERSRQSCVDFINSLKRRGVIRAKE